MSSEVPPPPQPEHETHPLPEVRLFPRWVPALIGAVLVAIAALAVWTGWRHPERSPLGRVLHPRKDLPRANAAPPGEPEAGSSLVIPGESADNTPVANPPVSGRSRAVIAGGGRAGVSSSIRIWARRGMLLTVQPNDAMIYVNDVPIGAAHQFDSENEIYDFPDAGSYTVRIVAPGFRPREYVITAAHDAEAEVARVEVKLERE